MPIIKKSQVLKIAVSFLLAFLILYFFISSTDIGKIIKVISNANFLLLFAAFALFYAVLIIKSLRWKIFLANAGFKENFGSVLEVYFLGQFINTLLPARLGDFYKSHLMKKNFGISGSKAFGTVFVDRLFDLILTAVLFVVAAFALFGGNIPYGIKKSILLLSLLALAVLAAIFLFHMKKKFMIGIIPKRFKNTFKNFQSAAYGSLNLRTLPMISILTLIAWLFEFTILYLITKSIGLNLSIYLIIFIVIATYAVMIIPLTPAGLGFVEAGIAGILLLVGIDRNLAISVALINSFISYWNQLIFGFLVYLVSKLE